jgi:L-ascorbate 6-phosphate lactonase
VVRRMDDIVSARVASGKLAVWWLGQAGFVLKDSRGKIVVIDPYLSESVGRVSRRFARLYPPPMEPEELVCDVVVCTHDHLDHLDPETIGRLRNRSRMYFVGPRNAVRHFRRLGIGGRRCVTVDAGESRRVAGFEFCATFCVPNEPRVLDSAGYVIRPPRGPSFYHSGDTAYVRLLGYIAGLEPKVAAVCINGKYGNMGYRGAARLVKQIGARISIPQHYDLFGPNREKPERFCRQLRRIGARSRCVVPRVMERVDL